MMKYLIIMNKLCCEREIFSNLLILAQGQQVPDAAMVLTPYVTTTQNTYFSIVCVFTNPTAPNNINATWLWTSYNNSNCCVDQGMSMYWVSERLMLRATTSIENAC